MHTALRTNSNAKTALLTFIARPGLPLRMARSRVKLQRHDGLGEASLHENHGYIIL